jgi:hypothetical protein
LYIALLRRMLWTPQDGDPRPVWRSRLHHDGSSIVGFFLLGLGTEAGTQISYHLPLGAWDTTEFADTLERAPTWDGHTPADVVARVLSLL